MVLIGKFPTIMHQNAHLYTKYGFRFWHTLAENLHDKNSRTLCAGKIDGFLVRRLQIG